MVWLSSSLLCQPPPITPHVYQKAHSVIIPNIFWVNATLRADLLEHLNNVVNDFMVVCSFSVDINCILLLFEPATFGS